MSCSSDPPFAVVKNGQANTVVFAITNPPKEDRLLTLQSVTGAFLNPKKLDGQRGRVLRNVRPILLILSLPFSLADHAFPFVHR